MSTDKTTLVTEDRGTLQIPYTEYATLMEKAKEAEHIRQVKNSVVAHLEAFLGGKTADNVAVPAAPAAQKAPKGKKAKTEKPMTVKEVKVKEKPAAEPAVEPVQEAAKAPASGGRTIPTGVEIPPIKKDISVHFNNMDESGRLFSVFKQYYACLNDACGGTVRVTMKDGFCSLWNYDEWEEFAFVDIFEGQLRVALDPRYTAALQSLNLCEVPRLLSSRRSLICVQVDGLNNTMLDVLVKAFEEVGLAAS